MKYYLRNHDERYLNIYSFVKEFKKSRKIISKYYSY